MSEPIVLSPTDRIAKMLERVEYRLAESAEDRSAIYRLRYRAYLKEGAIAANAQGLTTDAYDDCPNSWIFGVHVDGELTSSLRISVASPECPHTPSTNVFPELLKPELAQRKVLVDPTRFVADPERANRFAELPYITLRLAYVACEYFNADVGLASVRSEHQAFYRRVFMHPIAAVRDYPGLVKPISLMAIDFPSMSHKVFTRFPFLRSTPAERRRLFARDDAGFAAPDYSRATMAPRH